MNLPRRLPTFALCASTFLCASTYLCTASAQQPVAPATPAPAASPAAPTAAASKDPYARESAVLERIERIYRYAADGTGTEDITAVADLRNAAAVKAWSIIVTAFPSASAHVEIDYVRVRRPDGTIVSTPATDAQEEPLPVTREAPFYSDLKMMEIPVRSLREGDHVEYHTRIIITKPEAPGHFWQQETLFTPSLGAVVLNEVVELHVPKGVFVQTSSPEHIPVITETATEKVFRWNNMQWKSVAGRSKEELLRIDPEALKLDENGDHLPAIAWSNFHSWAEVGAWYRSMEAARMDPDDDVRARVKELIAGKSTDEDKARAIYGYVGPQVRYIGVAFGIGRFQPHAAGEVLRNQYGDCKDKHTLQAAMLSAAGIPADTVLIGSGVAFNEALPSPGSFNHVITLAHIDGKPVWLDATAEVAPYRLLLSTLRGKQALVVPVTGEAHIERTPKDLPFKPEIHFDAIGSLDERGTSHSHLTMVLRGDEEVLYRAAVRSVSPSQWDELMQNISRGMSFAGKVTNAEFSKPDQTSDAFHVAYDYEREKSGDWDNYRILPQLVPVGLGAVDEKDLPVLPIELGTPHVQLDHAVMTLPTGWGADLPPAIHAKAVFATLDQTYKLEGGKLITDRRIEILQAKVPAADWPAYKKWYSDANLDGENYVQLTRTGGSRQAGTDDPKAAALINEAQRLEQERSWDAARAKVDQAKAINPKQAYLWSHYGFLAMVSGKFNEAIEDFQRELVAHPDEDNVSMLLAQTQAQQHKTAEAIATLQTLVSRNPGNEQANNLLTSLLLTDKQYPAAEKSLRGIIAAHPDNVQMQLFLSTALVRQGKKAEATAILKSIAEKSQDPALLNDAAYALADENLDVPLAVATARRSLAALEAAPNPKPLVQAELLVSVWDTLGWALFRDGKTAEAAPLIRAAWTNALTAEPGYHLGMVLEKLGQPDKAMAVYQMAAFGTAGANADAIADANTARQTALRKAGTPSQVHEGKAALQNLRTFTVPGKNTLTGSATVDLEFSATGPANATIVKDDPKQAPLTSVESSLYSIDYKAGVPPGSHATLTRRGILSCHAGTSCQFVLLSTRAALSN